MFYVSDEDYRAADTGWVKYCFNPGQVHTEKQLYDEAVKPVRIRYDLPPRNSMFWCRELKPEDFEGCQTVEECQAVVDEACREAGTDTDPNWVNGGPYPVFESVDESFWD